jgi:hypothetical protein
VKSIDVYLKAMSSKTDASQYRAKTEGRPISRTSSCGGPLVLDWFDRGQWVRRVIILSLDDAGDEISLTLAWLHSLNSPLKITAPLVFAQQLPSPLPPEILSAVHPQTLAVLSLNGRISTSVFLTDVVRWGVACGTEF